MKNLSVIFALILTFPVRSEDDPLLIGIPVGQRFSKELARFKEGNEIIFLMKDGSIRRDSSNSPGRQ